MIINMVSLLPQVLETFGDPRAAIITSTSSNWSSEQSKASLSTSLIGSDLQVIRLEA